MRKRVVFLVMIITNCLYFCFSYGGAELPNIERQPPPLDLKRGVLQEFPRYDPADKNPLQVDLRYFNLSGLDLREQLPSLLKASFDTQTLWPPAKNMPVSFQPGRILELGKDPGLNIRRLHARGITGRGIGIAIIDQPVLVEHDEYKDRWLLYAEMNIKPSTCASMHGSAVCSVLAGKTTGVAPGIDLYYIATWPGVWSKEKKGGFDYDLTFYADALKKIIALNRALPAGKKIRAVAFMLGFSEKRKGFAAMTAAIASAAGEGIFVISCSLAETHGFKFNGLDRGLLADPDIAASYSPASWWMEEFFQGKAEPDRLLLPMDSRTLAGPAGPEDYAFYRFGGWSWVTPYIAGLYALGCQVKGNLTPAEFWKTALATASFAGIKRENKTYRLGPIINPVALIESLSPSTGDERKGQAI